jgi:xylan 1,4-beta-xylosidase
VSKQQLPSYWLAFFCRLCKAGQQRVIAVNLRAIKGQLSLTFNACIGAGRANEGLRTNWQQQLAQIERNAESRYIRVHGLLTDDIGRSIGYSLDM